MQEKRKNSSTLRERLRQVREKLDMTQSELAKELGFSANTIISQFEKGRTQPTVKTLAKLAAKHDVDLHWLITGQPSPLSLRLAEELEPCVQDYLLKLSQEITELETQGLRLDMRLRFRAEGSQDELSATLAERDRLQDQYKRILDTVKQVQNQDF